MAGNFIPALWAGTILKALEKVLVFAARCNRNYEGEIKDAGDRVKIFELGQVAVNAYTKNSTTLTYQNITDAGTELMISESKSFSFKLDDVDRFQAKPELLIEAMRKAAYAVRDEVDRYVAGLYEGAGVVVGLGTETAPLSISSTKVLETLLLLSQKLDEKNVPIEGRWIVIPPWLKTKIVLSQTRPDATPSTNNAAVMAAGYVGRFAGFDIYVSNNGSANGTTCYRVLAGTDAAITFASQVERVENLRLEGSFSDAVRGLYLYGAKVIQPDALACLRCAPGAET